MPAGRGLTREKLGWADSVSAVFMANDRQLSRLRRNLLKQTILLNSTLATDRFLTVTHGPLHSNFSPTEEVPMHLTQINARESDFKNLSGLER